MLTNVFVNGGPTNPWILNRPRRRPPTFAGTSTWKWRLPEPVLSAPGRVRKSKASEFQAHPACDVRGTVTRPPLAPIGNGPGASENEHRLGVAGVVAAGADGELLPLQ